MHEDARLLGTHRASHKVSPLRNVDRIRGHQPHVTIDPGTLVKPTFALRGVRAHHKSICARAVHEIGDVEGERRIPAQVAPEIMAIENDDRIAKYAVKFE